MSGKGAKLLPALVVRRIGRHASGNLAMELYRVPEDRMQQNIDLLEKMLDRSASTAEIAAAAADVLPPQAAGAQPHAFLHHSETADTAIAAGTPLTGQVPASGMRMLQNEAEAWRLSLP